MKNSDNVSLIQYGGHTDVAQMAIFIVNANRRYIPCWLSLPRLNRQVEVTIRC